MLDGSHLVSESVKAVSQQEIESTRDARTSLVDHSLNDVGWGTLVVLILAANAAVAGLAWFLVGLG